MILGGKVGKLFVELVDEHAGHELEVVYYGLEGRPDEYSIECVDCGEVLITAPVE